LKDIKFYLTKPEVIRATLAILALRTGTSIAYGGIDSADLLAKVQANPDAVNIMGIWNDMTKGDMIKALSITP